jgi:hypothetical protein
MEELLSSAWLHTPPQLNSITRKVPVILQKHQITRLTSNQGELQNAVG